ncbi:hypothetical protein EYD10_07159 [Varanus komodoensis]|nr:hypothetical protein EYD10_07159 [Varanus komodoensis]
MESSWLSLVLLAALDLALQWGLWVAAAALRTEKFFDAAGFSSMVVVVGGSTAMVRGLRVKNTWLSTTSSLEIRQWILIYRGPIPGVHFLALPRKRNIRLAGTSESPVGSRTASSAAGPDSPGDYLGPQVRLGLFLFLRILKEGHDKRFNGIRENPGTFFLYWTMQGIWVFITLLPTLLLNLEKNGKPLGFWDYLGWSIWAVGFTTEAVADQQKWHFRSNPDNADKFIQSGLWAYSRHPNYLGEILLWTGLFVSATSVLHGWQYVSVLSPLLVWFLLSHVSGVPILEKAAMKKWGKQAAFQAYLRETPMLWPVSLRL